MEIKIQIYPLDVYMKELSCTKSVKTVAIIKSETKNRI